MDEIFHDVHGFRGAFDVVKVSLTKPRRFGKNGELLIDYEDTEMYRDTARRRSSVASQGIPQPQQNRESAEAQQDEEKGSDSNGH